MQAFDALAGKILDAWQRAAIAGGSAGSRCHPDDIIARIAEGEANIFRPLDVEETPPSSVPAPAPAGSGRTSQNSKVVCWSWLSNGACRAHAEGECDAMHPEGMRGQHAGGDRANGRNRKGGGGGGGRGGNGGGGPSYDYADSPWAAYYTPPWAGKGWGAWHSLPSQVVTEKVDNETGRAASYSIMHTNKGEISLVQTAFELQPESLTIPPG